MIFFFIRPTARSALPIKKSQVTPSQTGLGTKNESLWQRMLQLTSELSRKKFRETHKGAARSELNKMDSNDNNTPYTTSSANADQTAAEYAQRQDETQQAEFQRLQQYWNEYYRNYYQSLKVGQEGVGAQGSTGVQGVTPDWMLRSPWSTDPEHVEGALDKDTVGKADQPNATTLYQNWNSYLQSFYQYPTQSSYSNASTTYSYQSPEPNSSSDHFIDKVISNDLEARKISDASVNRDLYYEDQLLHSEEAARPFLNASYYNPTKLTSLQTTQTTQNNTQQSVMPSQTGDQTKPLEYSATLQASNNSVIDSPVPPVYNVATTESSTTLSTTTARHSLSTTVATISNTTTHNQSVSSVMNETSKYQNSSLVSDPDLLNSNPDASRSIDSSNRDESTTPDSTDGISRTSNTNRSSLSPTLKVLANLISTSTKKATTNSRSNDGAQQAPLQTFVPDKPIGDPEDDSSYLDDLDITALVRELIKLETIRKQKQIRRKKKVEKENAKVVGNMLVGDVFKGYFKNKNARNQKGLKKHLLNKARLLLSLKGKGSPLPRFS